MLRDRVARFLQTGGRSRNPDGLHFVLSGEAERWSFVRPEVLMIYPGCMVLLAAAYGYWVGIRWHRTVPLLILAGWIVVLGGRGYQSLRTAGRDRSDRPGHGLPALGPDGQSLEAWHSSRLVEAWLKPPISVAPSAEMGNEGRRDEKDG